MKSKRSSRWNDKSVEKRLGKNNQAYRNGMYSKGNKKNSTGLKEFNRNKKIIKDRMIEDVGYIYCEDCRTSNSLKFESHHIIFRSEKPLHKHLHCEKNIIHLCIDCHNKYHKTKGRRNGLVKYRELNLLFGDDVLNK